MDLQLLRTLAAVARNGGIGRAAAELGFAQSTISTHIQALEKDLGVRLVERLPSGVRVTDAGEIVLAHARQMLDLDAALRHRLAGSDVPAGPLVLVAAESMCAYRLPSLTLQLRATHPDVSLTLRPGGTAEALAQVRTGQADAAVVIEPRMTPDDLRSLRLGAEPIHAYAAPDHPLTGRSRLSVRDLGNQTIILTEPGCSYTDLAVAGLRDAATQPREILHFGNVEAIVECVAAGLGVTVLPASAAQRPVEPGRLAQLVWPSGLPHPRVSAQLLWPRHRWISPALRAFITLARNAPESA